MGVHTEAVQKLYVAYFNRPADYTGLKFWEEKMAAGVSSEAIAASFAQSPEYKQTYAGKTNFEIINQIYLNLFNREADLPGAEHWDRLLTNGTFTIDEIVTIIADTASDTEAKDKTTLANKIAAATAFSAQLDTVAEAIGYGGDKANQAAKNWLSTIGTKESLDAATAPAALASAVAAVANTGLVSGPAQALTTSVDTLTGTSGNDVFTGLINNVGGSTGDLSTLTALDTITGGAGVDTLQINALTEMTAAPSITVSGVEVVTVRAAKSVTADISAWNGVEQFNVTEAVGSVDIAAGATTNISASMKAGTKTATLNGDTVTVGSTVAVDGGKDVVVRVTDISRADQTIDVGQDVVAKGIVSVEAVGKAAVLGSDPVNMGAINVKGGTTINVTQVANGSTAALGVGEKTTHNQGDISIEGTAATTTVNVKQTAAVLAQQGVAEVAEKTEVVSVKFAALAKGQSLTVAGLTFTADKAMTANQVAAAFSKLTEAYVPEIGDTQGGGLASNGTYTGKINGWTSSAATGDTVVFTSTVAGELPTEAKLKFTGSALNNSTSPATPAATLPVLNVTTVGDDEEGNTAVLGVTAGKVSINDVAHSIKTVTVDGYGDGEGNLVADTSGIKGSTVLETLSLSNSLSGFGVEDTAATLNLNLNKIGTAGISSSVAPVDATDAAITFGSAPATLNVKSTGNNYVDLTAAATKALNVSGTGVLKVDAVDLGSLETIKITETAGLNLATLTGVTHVASVTSVDASGTSGNVTIAINGGKATYAGGSGKDSVTIAAETTAITKAINLGAGDDRLNLSNLDSTKLGNTGATIVMEGGEGTDTLALSAEAAGALSATPAFETKFNGFEKLEVGTVFTNTTVNMDNMDDINYVIAKGAATADAPAALTVGTKVDGAAAVTEKTVVAFKALATGESISLAGRTVTAKVDMTADIVAGYFLDPQNQDTNEATATGTIAGWTHGANNSGVVTFTSATPNTNVADLKDSLGVDSVAPVFETTPGQAARNETNVVVFKELKAGQSYTVAGRVVTASGTATAAQVAEAFISGKSTNILAVSGTLTGWTVDANGTTADNDAIFTSTTTATDITESVTLGASGATGATKLTLDKMLNNATVQLDGPGAIEVKLADASGTSDVVNFITNSTKFDLGTVTAAKVETINIKVNDADTSSGFSSNKLTVAADSAKTINVSGAGYAEVVLKADTTKSVTLIDGSTATGDLTLASSTDKDAVAVTIKGGEGYDMLIASGNKADVLLGGAGDDILVAGTGLATLTGGEGNDVFRISVASANVNSYATITDFGAGDLIQFVGQGLTPQTKLSFTSTKIELADTAVFQDYANDALNKLTEGQIGWFQVGGNTYIVADMNGESSNGFAEGKDFIVKLTGTVDLSNASFNSDYGTIGLI